MYGTDVTGLDYFTLPMGPVPLELFKEFSDENDTKKYENIFKTIPCQDKENPEYKWFKIQPKKGVKPNLEIFTQREKDILSNLVFIYKDATAKTMSEITHLKNSPWDKTKKSKGMNQLIDYELAHDKESTLDIEELIERFNLDRELSKLS